MKLQRLDDAFLDLRVKVDALEPGRLCHLRQGLHSPCSVAEIATRLLDRPIGVPGLAEPESRHGLGAAGPTRGAQRVRAVTGQVDESGNAGSPPRHRLIKQRTIIEKDRKFGTATSMMIRSQFPEVPGAPPEPTRGRNTSRNMDATRAEASSGQPPYVCPMSSAARANRSQTTRPESERSGSCGREAWLTTRPGSPGLFASGLTSGQVPEHCVGVRSHGVTPLISTAVVRHREEAALDDGSWLRLPREVCVLAPRHHLEGVNHGCAPARMRSRTNSSCFALTSTPGWANPLAELVPLMISGPIVGRSCVGPLRPLPCVGTAVPSRSAGSGRESPNPTRERAIKTTTTETTARHAVRLRRLRTMTNWSKLVSCTLGSSGGSTRANLAQCCAQVADAWSKVNVGPRRLRGCDQTGAVGSRQRPIP